MTDELGKEVLERICAVCVDRRDDGSCGLDSDLRCSIELHLAGILETLKNVSSPRLKDYAERMRRTHCAVCEDRGPGDSFEVPDRADCPLDHHLLLVVKAIEKVRRRNGVDFIA